MFDDEIEDELLDEELLEEDLTDDEYDWQNESYDRVTEYADQY